MAMPIEGVLHSIKQKEFYDAIFSEKSNVESSTFANVEVMKSRRYIPNNMIMGTRIVSNILE